MKPTPAQLKILKINRKQYKLMTKAGFQATVFDNQKLDDKKALIYWKRGDVTICLFRYESPSIKTLTERLIKQISYTASKVLKERVGWIDTDKPLFKFSNNCEDEIGS